MKRYPSAGGSEAKNPFIYVKEREKRRERERGVYDFYKVLRKLS